MSQVSLPMRIALGVTLAFFAIWFVALRPKTPSAPATPPPAGAQSAPGKAAEQAQQAVDASQQAAAKHEAATGAQTAQPGDAQSAKPATDAAKPGAPVDVQKAAGDKASKAAQAVLRDVSRGKVAVLLFWDRRLSDDRAVHEAVESLSRRGGKVAVHVAPIGRLAQYEPITRGVPVVTSPTVLIVDRAGHARSVGGLSVPSELEELVGKALKVKP